MSKLIGRLADNPFVRAWLARPLDQIIDAKVIATTATALLAGWIVALGGKYLGVTPSLPLVVAIVGPPIYAGVQFAVGYVKRDPRVEALIDFYRSNGQPEPESDEGLGHEAGLSAIEVVVAVLVVLVVLLIAAPGVFR